MAACSGGGFLLTLGGQPRPNGGEVWGGGVPQDLILTLVGQYMNIYLLYLCCSAWLYFFRFWGSKMRVLVHPGCYFLQLINLNGNTRYTRPGWGGTDMCSEEKMTIDNLSSESWRQMYMDNRAEEDEGRDELTPSSTVWGVMTHGEGRWVSWWMEKENQSD